jgi:hypothetical protein
MTGVQVYPRITGSDSAEVAAQLAVMDWTSSNVAVFALAKDSFPAPSNTSGEAEFTFQDAAVTSYTSNEVVNYGSIANISFTPQFGWKVHLIGQELTSIHISYAIPMMPL